MTPAERHRAVAGTFGDRVAGVTDWSVPTPVAEWTARDVLAHLLEWFPGFLAAGDVQLESGPPIDDDPVVAWEHHAAEVQRLLDGPAAAADFTHPHLGTMPLEQAVDNFYTSDIFMHTWDLARATGQDDRLDPETCAALLSGMGPIEDVLRGSGQYGPRVPVPDDADVQDRLLGFIGRDPAWRP